MKNREVIQSLPSRLIILYDNGYKEIAKYDYKNDKFNHFEIFNEDDNEILNHILLKKESLIRQVMTKEVVDYLDINNFSFLVKKHRRELPFSKYSKDDKVTRVEITLPDLMFIINNNKIHCYVSRLGKLYYNPLPNITNDNICLGTADRSFEKKDILSEKIEKIKYTFFESTFSHEINFDILQSWFDGKPNYKLLRIKK